MHACVVPVKSHCTTSCLLQDVRTGVSDDSTTQTPPCIGAFTVKNSSATVAVDQRGDTPVSSSHSGPDDEDDCSAPPTPPSFTHVGGATNWEETLAHTNLTCIHPQTAKYQMQITVRPEKKVGWAGGAGSVSWLHHLLGIVKHNSSTVVLTVRLLNAKPSGSWERVILVLVIFQVSLHIICLYALCISSSFCYLL